MKSGLHWLFLRGQSLGFDLLPRHFYSSIPDVAELARSQSWRSPSAMPGVRGAGMEEQLAFAESCCPPALRERLTRGGIFEHACRENGAPGFGRTEADFLFGFIASKQPRRIVQIGSGVSTAVVLLAAEESGYRPEIVCVDPFPTSYLRRAAGEKKIQLLPQAAQEVDLNVFTSLNSGDLLFVDSTHAVRPGGEVNRIVLEVLPRLSAGVYAHFHDIAFPFDYQPGLMNSLFFPSESTLLQAYLAGNARCSVAVSLSMLHHARPQALQSLLPNYRPAAMQLGLHAHETPDGDFPSSTYLLFS